MWWKESGNHTRCCGMPQALLLFIPPCPIIPGMPVDGHQGERPWISIYFKCCRVYLRIYRNLAHTAYVGWCPKCTAKVTVRIGPEGKANRFFTAE